MICSICKVDRTESEFFTRQDTRRAWCKSCDKFRAKVRSHNIDARIKEAHKIVSSCAYCVEAEQILFDLIENRRNQNE